MLRDPHYTADAIARWIRSYFDQSLPGASAVIGISGGKDSAVVAALCVKALGKERVIGVLMPDGEQKDIADSRAVVEHLGIRSICVDISPFSRAFAGTLPAAEGFAEVTGHSALEGEAAVNFPARLRMTTLYAVAQSLPAGGLVLNTCNLSEDWVGYSTKFGDAAGDLSPLAQIRVSEVRELGIALGLPERLVYKTPSDGLSGLSDEAKLGFTYAMLDEYLETGVCPDPAVKAKIDRLHAANLHKLNPMPHFEKTAEH